MHNSFHLYLESLGQQVVEDAEDLNVSHFSRVNSWHVKLQSESSHQLVTRVHLCVQCHGWHPTIPVLLQLVNPLICRPDPRPAFIIQDSQYNVPIKSHICMLKVYLFFGPESYHKKLKVSNFSDKFEFLQIDWKSKMFLGRLWD